MRLCGSFPFYFPCVDISYWVPKWMLEVAVMTKPQVGSGVPNKAGKVPLTNSRRALPPAKILVIPPCVRGGGGLRSIEPSSMLNKIQPRKPINAYDDIV